MAAGRAERAQATAPSSAAPRSGTATLRELFARRPYAFVVLVLSWNALLLAAFATQLSLGTGPFSITGALASGAFFASWVVDILLVASAGALLVNGPLPARLAAYAIFLVHFLGNAVQLAAHYVGGEFLTRLAVENANHASLLLDARWSAAVAGAVAFALAVPILTETKARAPWRDAGKVALAGLALALLAALAPRALPARAARLRQELFDDNNVTGRSPFFSLVEVLAARGGGRVRFTADDARAVAPLGFAVSPASAYPLRKPWIYEGPPPFETLPGAPPRPNVVVFFTEGLSARLTSPYGAPFPGITPNMGRFAADPASMTVTRYYNHTAATYRGLQGQLCSLYPKDEGSDAWLSGSPEGRVRSYFSLADYLRGQGYETVFLDAHRKGAARVGGMMERLGFESVLGAEELAARYLRGAAPQRDDALSDHQLLEALCGFLREREGRGAGARPFFVALYNLETHAFQDAGVDGLRYGDGTHRCLNTVHGFDDAFGEFLDRFLGSPLAGRTVVVLTADHCHYPTRAYLDALRPRVADLPRYFVDEIPLVIRSPLHRLPHVFDARFGTSIDFAPTLVHLLGLPQAPNPFLGRSLFSPRAEPEPGIASIGPELFFVDGEGIARRGRLRGYARDYWRVQRFLRYLADLEEHGRIWPRAGGAG